MKRTGTLLHELRALLIIIGCITVAFFIVPDLAAQDDDTPPVPLPTTIEVKDDDYVVTDKTALEYLQRIEGKIDWIMERIDGAPQEPEVDTRPNINTIDEANLAMLMRANNIWASDRMATLIWVHIHDGGNLITSVDDYKNIDGVGEKTFKNLWPLIKTSD